MHDVVYLKPCRKHRPANTEMVAASQDPDRTMDVILCMACWRKNPTNIEALLDIIGVFGPDRDAVMAHRK